MGKKAKKKARSVHKDKKVSTASTVSVHDDQNPTVERVKSVTSVVQDRKECVHLDKSMDLAKVSSKLELAEAFRCEDCRGGVGDRKAAKGKGKNGKTKGNNSKAIWVCLECGHFGCGGVGLPTTPQSHAVRHARQSRHSLAIQIENPHLRWCFPCSTLIRPEKSDENGEQKDLLADVAKLIKKQPPNGALVDVEDVWFGSGSVLSEVKSEKGLDFYAVRGLSNLGNTCFFNSVLQNLLAMDKLQDFLLNLDDCSGPLTNSLKKLYIEVNADAGARNVINPRSLFGSICSKAPQFRGYQQQDSHELLRCLLDGLSTEDLRAKKMGVKSSDVSASFVDSIFGGQLSSTVCCVECGHSSVVYEPFLDLSLPVPTKKPPPKKAKAVSRKTKPPPKRVAMKTRLKHTKSVASAPILADSRPSCESSSGLEPSAVNPENSRDSVDDFSWLDYLEPSSMGDEHDPSSQCDELPTNQESDSVHQQESGPEVVQNYAINQDLGTCSNEVQNFTSDLFVRASEDEIPMQFGDSEVLLLPYKEETADESEIPMQFGDSEVLLLPYKEETADESEIPMQFGDSEVLLLPYKEETADESEIPMQVGDSEILLLPYKEETADAAENNLESAIEPSSSVVGDDFSGFDGFADMFNEPEEISIGCSAKPSEAVSNSGSEAGEVDDTDAPVSIESCLSHFTKPELLSDECSWHCENCTKMLLEEKKKSRKKKAKPGSVIQNGFDDSSSRFANGSAESSIYQICNGTASSEDKERDYHGNGKVEETVEGCESGESEEETDSKTVKVMRDATKRYLISKLPPILTVHLKRFSQDARGRLSKLNGHVAFKEVVDLKQYVDSRCLERQEGFKYRLLGVVEHTGNMRGGHYVAYIRGGDKRKAQEVDTDRKSVWYYASDSYVRETSLEDVLRCEAYILFYEKL